MYLFQQFSQGVYRVLFPILMLCFFLSSTTVQARRYTTADTSLVLKLARASIDSNYQNPAASLALAEDAIRISGEINYQYGLAKGLIAKAIARTLLGKPDEAFNLYLQALSIANKNKYESVIAAAHDYLSIAYSDKGEHAKAVTQLDTAIKIYTALNDSFALAKVYKHFGNLMQDMDNFGKAIEYKQKAIDLYQARHERAKVGEMYASVAGTFIMEKKYAEAFHYLYGALHISDSTGDKRYLQLVYMNLGLCHGKVLNFDSALVYYFKSLEILRQKKDVSMEITLLCDIGACYARMNKADKAEPYVKESLELAKEVGDRTVMLMSYDNLSGIYQMKGDYKKGLLYRDSAFAMQDTIYTMSQANAIAEITTKYETREMEHKNALLQQENSLQKLRLQRKDIVLYSSLGAALLFLVIGFLLVRQNKLKTNEQKLELEQKQLLAQMNPHFIFNCLNSIQHFVMENDKLNANRYLADFAMLMRQTLDNSKDGIISLTREVEYLENYLSFEYMRFKDKFTYSITCDAELNMDMLELPSMIIQPFVENAIRHGLCNLEDRMGMLKITFYKKDEILYCEIDDNGIGMDMAQKLKERAYIKYQSHGMELTRKRLALVSKVNSESYSVTIVNKKDEKQMAGGTTIIIKFPIQA